MKEAELDHVLKAVISTNLGLQNSLGIYAEQSARAISLLVAQPTSEARFARIEDQLNQIGNILNILVVKTQIKKRINKKNNNKKKKK